MKTAYGRLALLAFALLAGVLLFLPMRAGEQDQILISPAALRMSVGDSYAVQCELKSEKMDQWLRFTSSNEQVAAVDASGMVRALSSGEAVIRVRASGGASAETRVTVEGVPMRRLSLNVDELRMEKGQISGLRASYNADASDTRLKWTSSDESVVRVDSSGRVEGVGGGEAYVTVSAPSGRQASAKVYVDVAGTAAHISPNALTLGVGARVPLKVSYLPLDCTDRVRRWISSDPSVLTLDETGVLLAVGEGNAYVSLLTEGGLTCSMEVRVEAAPQGIQLNPARAMLERGEALQMQLIFLRSDGSVDEHSSHLTVWSSSDERVATVDQSGRVTALHSGSCTIEAASDGMVAACELRVQVSIQEITLDQTELFLLPDQARQPIQLKWVINPVDADDPGVRFESSNAQVAEASQTGLITMTGNLGTAEITAVGASGATARCVINVVAQLPKQATPEPTSTPAPAVTRAPTPLPDAVG